jgi:hypothetical protein
MKCLLAFVIGGLLVWAVMRSKEVVPQAQSVVPVPVPQVSDRAPTMEEQSLCARQAREEFARGGWKVTAFVNFNNHYSPKLGKCYIEITDSSMAPGNIPSETKLVGDAFEGTVVARYNWSNPNGKQYWEVKPYECSVNGTHCESSDEFDAMVAKEFGLEPDK